MIFTDREKQDIARVAALPYNWEKFRNKTILLSGGTGFIGSHLIAVFMARNEIHHDNIKVVCVSRRGGTDSDYIKNIAADITAPFNVDGNVDFVIHLASNTHPAQYSTDPVGTITTNVLGCHNLLELARKKNAERFLLASSVEIYGNGSETPMKEDYCGYIDCNTARAGYNESKRVSESLCQAYIGQYGMDCVVARLSRVFGADRKVDSKALAQFIDKAVAGEDIVLKSEGKQRFSYCYVTDAVDGILKVLADGEAGVAYNISADDNGFTLGDIAKYIASLAHKKVIFDLDNVQRGASVAAYALVDCAKLKSLGWTPFYTVEQGLDMTYRLKKALAETR